MTDREELQVVKELIKLNVEGNKISTIVARLYDYIITDELTNCVMAKEDNGLMSLDLFLEIQLKKGFLKDYLPKKETTNNQKLLNMEFKDMTGEQKTALYKISKSEYESKRAKYQKSKCN